MPSSLAEPSLTTAMPADAGLVPAADTIFPHPEGFALLRLVLIDSLSPGRIVELPLAGGAVLTGRNGRGKTSLLQLLLLFYGESPNRIVTAEAGRETFTGYYLPRTTSYLAFEYQRHGGHKRMVVAYADKSGERVLYRFIRSHFDVSQFIRADGEFVKVPDFRTHLQTHGFQCSERQIESQSDYRNIIQGIPGNSTDKQHQLYLRQLTQDYAFTTTRQPLRQIEKIVSGMFRRKTNFEDLQSMVIDCVADEMASHAISGDRRKIEDWPRGYKAYAAVMALEPRMQAAELAESQLQAAELALGDIGAKYRSLGLHLDEQANQASKAMRQVEEQAQEEEKGFQQQRQQITAEKATTQRQAEFAEQQASELQRQAQAYAQEGIEALDARVRQAPALRSERPLLETRRQALLGAQSDIAGRYERLKQIEKDAHNGFRDAEQARRNQATKACELDLAELATAQDAAEQLIQSELAAARAPLDQAVQTANSEHGRCQSGVEHPAPDAAIATLVECKRDALDAARQAASVVDEQRRALDDLQRKALQAFLDRESDVSAASRQLDKAQAELDAKRLELAPPEGTLLHFLRQEHPRWSLDIAKVLRGDMLGRTDLAPALNEPEGTLYGLSLNLERLDAHPASDVRSAELDVERGQTRVKEASQVLGQARARLAQANDTRIAAEKACQLHQQHTQKAKNQAQSAAAELEEAKRQLEVSRAEALAAARQRLDSARLSLDNARQALRRFDEATSAEAAKVRTLHAQQRQARQLQRDAKVQRIDAAVARQEAELAQKLAGYDSERDEALMANGVDPARLAAIDREIDRIQTELSAIGIFIERVQEWRFWKEHQWPALQERLDEAAQARQAEQQRIATIARIDSQWTTRSHQLQQEIGQFRATLASSAEQRRLVQGRLDSLQGYPEVCVSAYDASWTFDALCGLANQYVQDTVRLGGSIRRTISDVALGFRLHQGTPPEQYLQSALSTLSPAPSREWLAPLKAWFATAHHEYRRILLMQAVSIASEVNAFHRTMEEFHRRVQQFNRELQEHLDTSLAFESISKISVEVVSTIRELQYWPAICEMAEAHRAWAGSSTTALPPPEFAQTIERLLEHWEVKTGIRADLKGLIRIQGEVTENGNRRVFKRASDLEAVSSNGLSYLVLATIFVAFINRIRRNAQVNIIWALDELKDLDGGNVVGLIELLKRNNITLVCAFPDPDPDTMALFRHRFTVEPDRRLAEVRVAFGEFGAPDTLEASDADHAADALEVDHV
ncbi:MULTISPECIES: ATP-binding protein [unclassified Polaromonas]|uniref:ATP-binding protein n=1 Tax=unclassified Polaromonas TaxID=2638319 RepID=UPI0018C8FBCC|nr:MULTISPECIES: ATP-binding protein [unclassified Polaromonas]MBG6074081.1 hypothetical protein [Polaromonas sp. CG_9.7]MBG6116084.1 hypothetical protein [Polaromonas sp. CG_9.2]MDH6186516.1 hypothetical protein [Polaromonas sp. CG_23.6]